MSRWWLAALLGVVCVVAPAAARTAAGPQVVIDRDRLLPRALETLTGERVDFVNRTGRPVHVQFSADGHDHDVIQVPVTGLLWAVFHRPGTHPYVVHVYDGETRALGGVVVVTTDETHQWQAGTCGVVVEGDCIER